MESSTIVKSHEFSEVKVDIDVIIGMPTSSEWIVGALLGCEVGIVEG
jgi:hypothetical protein